MAIGLLRRLLKGNEPVDPTADWPESMTETPVVDLENRTIGRLKFNALIDGARYLGKPSLVRRRPDSTYLEFVYHQRGFQIDFENNRLVYAAFFVGPDEQLSSVRGLQYCSPRLHTGQHLSHQTSRNELERMYGSADHVDDMDAGDMILSYCRNSLILEFELNLDGCLKRWNLYPEREILQ